MPRRRKRRRGRTTGKKLNMSRVATSYFRKSLTLNFSDKHEKFFIIHQQDLFAFIEFIF